VADRYNLHRVRSPVSAPQGHVGYQRWRVYEWPAGGGDTVHRCGARFL